MDTIKMKHSERINLQNAINVMIYVKNIAEWGRDKVPKKTIVSERIIKTINKTIKIFEEEIKETEEILKNTEEE